MSDELQSGTIPPRALPSVATVANSTTLAEIERARKVSRAVIGALFSLGSSAGAVGAGTMGVLIPPPWNLVVMGIGGALVAASVVVAYRTNSLTPAELDALLAKLAGGIPQPAKAEKEDKS